MSKFQDWAEKSVNVMIPDWAEKLVPDWAEKSGSSIATGITSVTTSAFNASRNAARKLPNVFDLEVTLHKAGPRAAVEASGESQPEAASAAPVGPPPLPIPAYTPESGTEPPHPVDWATVPEKERQCYACLVPRHPPRLVASGTGE